MDRFDKTTGSLIGFSDLGDVNNLFAEYEQKDNALKQLAKIMMTVMVRGQHEVYLCTVSSCIYIFTIWKAIHWLTRLGLIDVPITCDGASKMFKMHGLTNRLPYTKPSMCF